MAGEWIKQGPPILLTQIQAEDARIIRFARKQAEREFLRAVRLGITSYGLKQPETCADVPVVPHNPTTQ